tara:strand:+ start:39 stop:590 length:552 start_codon:yes stop_codon:yes gene_type:complete
VKKFFYILFFFFFFQNNLVASNKELVIKKLDRIKNISFNFIQTINGKDEKGKCTIQYPKKIFCKYENRNNKVLVSNGSSLVIKKGQQYFRYPIESTPFELLLDKVFMINKIKFSPISEIENKYLFFQINEKNNNINVFFDKKNHELIGWQVEDIYQNLVVTFIFNTSINKDIDQKLFVLPENN